MNVSHPKHILISKTIETPIGGLVLVVDDEGMLRMAEFADCEDRMDRWLKQKTGLLRVELSRGQIATQVGEAFAAYFDGDLTAIDRIPVRLDGTAFQNECWAALRSIRPGETFGYGAFAERLGRAGSARAVGHANGANPLSIVVPCHRLVGADGSLTKYGGGLERKRWLLDHERRHAGG